MSTPITLAAPGRPQLGRTRADTPASTARDASRPVEQPWPIIRDTLFLGLVVLVSVIPYVGGLGFYSDDWIYLWDWSAAPDQSLPGLFRAVYLPWTWMRPVLWLHLSTLYWLFGAQPFGWHLANATLLFLNAALLYFVLRELGQSRSVALAVPLVYTFLPHYSTNRFWIGASSISLSLGLYLLSLYADLRAVRATVARFWSWRLLGLVGLVGSVLTYEVALPLFLVNPLLAWARARRRAALLLLGNLLVLLPLVVFKAQNTDRLRRSGSLLERITANVRAAFSLKYDDYDHGLNLKQALQVNYGELGFGLPRVIWRLLRDHPDATAGLLAAATGLLICAYLYRAGGRSEAASPSRFGWLGLAGAGVVLFGLGYAIFLTNNDVRFTATGLGNRTSAAATLGVALSLVGLLGSVGALPGAAWGRRIFPLLLALLCAGGVLINSTLATFWVEAYRQERAIVADLRELLPSLPVGSSLLLDGVCPYVGPAIVFESSWDLAGALLMFHPDQTLRADVVGYGVDVRKDGLYTSLYEKSQRYPYDKLFIYNFERKTLYEVTGYQSALRYFEASGGSSGNRCPPGHEGYGVRVF